MADGSCPVGDTLIPNTVPSSAITGGRREAASYVLGINNGWFGGAPNQP